VAGDAAANAGGRVRRGRGGCRHRRSLPRRRARPAPRCGARGHRGGPRRAAARPRVARRAGGELQRLRRPRLDRCPRLPPVYADPARGGGEDGDCVRGRDAPAARRQGSRRAAAGAGPLRGEAAQGRASARRHRVQHESGAGSAARDAPGGVPAPGSAPCGVAPIARADPRRSTRRAPLRPECRPGSLSRKRGAAIGRLGPGPQQVHWPCRIPVGSGSKRPR
jgi:hypothetical protein